MDLARRQRLRSVQAGTAGKALLSYGVLIFLKFPSKQFMILVENVAYFSALVSLQIFASQLWSNGLCTDPSCHIKI